MRRRDFLRGLAAAGAVRVVAPHSVLPAWVARGEEGPGAAQPSGFTDRLDDGWRFHLGDLPDAARPALDDVAWEPVMLPHGARLEALVTGAPGTPSAQWQGLCWYRRRLSLPAEAAGRRAFLHFEAAMNDADVWIDGVHLGRHRGGFLPFVLDVTDHLRPGGEVLLAVRLDNRDDQVTGPKPLHLLDFNMYHGLYRYVHLVVKDPLHITDPLFADRPASGGLFVTYPAVSPAEATVQVQTHLRNEHPVERTVRVRTTLCTLAGDAVVTVLSDAVTLPAGGDRDVTLALVVHAPRLWSPRAPERYLVRSELLDGDVVTDAAAVTIGIRRIAVDREGFRINGERMFLRGTNRHQEHPYVGFAVPEAAQWRDAQRIKAAGFDYVRLSHYPHAPAFMEACDELGLVVMNCLPGWQYFGADPAFAELQYRNVRDLIRRDRNHPCVVLWEVSLNETAMPPEFIARTQAIAHEEFPGDQCITCGWMPGYDVLIRARQHGGCPASGEQPCLVSEYGDWEYYAMTAGLDQDAWARLAPSESSSRQLRWQGERAQRQQATNFQEAHDDDRGSVAFGDGLWVMFDYDRGYAPDVESSGCADLLRVPKYSYHFFRSQRPPVERLRDGSGGPMAFIASEWGAGSALDIRVFSNCQQVELRLNGRTIARRGPDHDRISAHLVHPPFTFRVPCFEAGTLEAVGLIGDRAVAHHRVATAGAPAALRLSLDTASCALDPTGQDLLFARAALVDAASTVLGDAWENVAFGVTGSATPIGDNPFATDAGIASILLRTAPARRARALYALAIVRVEGAARVLGAALPLDGRRAPFELRVRRADAAPAEAWFPYLRPIPAPGAIRAELRTAGQTVAALDERAPKARMQASVAPPARGAFHRG